VPGFDRAIFTGVTVHYVSTARRITWYDFPRVNTVPLSLYRFVRNMFTVSQFKYCVPGVKFGVVQELSWS